MIPIKRCALYTRKSTEEGLDQAFNSLDAQREACEAYVKSQKSEGWRVLETSYDDGGFSGGTMERPAIKRLLCDIEAGKVDVVVVYKIDRLTRSLADFARIVELFDRHQVTFVSVTQAFNTTSSMGRLTLNVLLSFAQFEREVTGERIRDKIAASKSRGMWMGGTVPLGYDAPIDKERALVVNDAEAALVRALFEAYLELGSVHALEHWALQRGLRSKLYTTRAGKIVGGQMFSRGALFHLLRNRTYLGLIVHKDKIHPGLHPPIIEPDLFDAVEAKLNANKRRIETPKPHRTRAPLVGRIFDSDGEPMSPSFTRGKRGQPYRYYVSAPLQQGRRTRDDNGMRRVAGPTLEAMIATIIRRVAPKVVDPLSALTRVEVYADALQLLMPVGMITTVRTRLDENETVAADPANPAWLRLTIPVRMRLHGGRSWIVGSTAPPTRRDPALIKALRSAHALLQSDRFDLPTLEVAPTSPHCRNIIRLALLAPELQRAILAGRQPPGLTLQSLKEVEIPSLWAEQEAMIASLSVPLSDAVAPNGHAQDHREQ